MNRSVVLALALLVCAASCSPVLVKPVRVTPSGDVACTQSYTVPVVDGAVGVLGLGMPFVLEATRDRAHDDPNFVLYGALWATGVYAAVSAVIGTTRVKRCRRFNAAIAATAPTARE